MAGDDAVQNSQTWAVTGVADNVDVGPGKKRPSKLCVGSYEIWKSPVMVRLQS